MDQKNRFGDKMKIFTILELEKWMTKNGIKNTFTPGNRFESDEGLGLEIVSGLYVWYHSEGGQRDDLKYFCTEQKQPNIFMNI